MGGGRWACEGSYRWGDPKVRACPSFHTTLAPSPGPSSEAHSPEGAPGRALTPHASLSVLLVGPAGVERGPGGGSLWRGRGKPRGSSHSPRDAGTPGAEGKSQEGRRLRERSRVQVIGAEGHPSRALCSVDLCSCPQRSS